MAEIVADGPKLYEWLHRTGADLSEAAIGPNCDRRLREWKKGSNAGLAKVDEVCVLVGLHLSQVPDEIWIERPVSRPRVRLTADQKQKAVMRVLAGESREEVAASLGCSARAISYWVHRFRPDDA